MIGKDRRMPKEADNHQDNSIKIMLEMRKELETLKRKI